MAMLDIDFVRAQFPAFDEPSLQGQAHFENAGGSYACAQVIDRLTRFYRQTKVQPYYPSGAATRAGAEMDEARARLSALLNVAPDELHFGPSTSQNTYVLSRAFGQMLRPGDVVVVTNQDHEANSGAWRRLVEQGMVLREWQVDPVSGLLDTADLPALLDGARLLCFTQCSNIVGAPNPVADICAMARSAGAWTCVDGVSHAPHGLPDVGALGCDIYLFSAYKTHGPHQGIMTIRAELADLLPPQCHFFNAGARAKRFTPAGPDHAQVAACAGMVDYVDALFSHHFPGQQADPATRGRAVRQLQRDAESARLAPLMDYLCARNDIRLIGPRDVAGRVPTVALVAQRPAPEITSDLAALGIMAGSGDFYARRLVQALGIDPEAGVLRLSFVHYTSAAEVDRLIGALDRVF